MTNLKNIKWDEERIKLYVENNGYNFIKTVSGIGASSVILISCNKNHEPYEVRFYNFYSGKRCPKCKFNKLSNLYRKKLEDVKKIINDNNLTWISGEYESSKSPLIVRCEKGHEYKTNISIIQRGFKCPHCFGNAKLNLEYIKDYIENKIHYKLLSTSYINASSKLELQCDKGHIFHITWNKIKNGRRCPICKQSRGEQKIREVLEENGIDFISQYTFNNCINIRPLPFDVYLPDYNTCIEYDGSQHFTPSEHFGGVIEYEKRKKNDYIKDEYCKENNIRLIRIPFWDYENIENIILEKILSIKNNKK